MKKTEARERRDDLRKRNRVQQKGLPAFRRQPFKSVIILARACEQTTGTCGAETLTYPRPTPTIVRGFAASSFFAFFKVFLAMIVPPYEIKCSARGPVCKNNANVDHKCPDPKVLHPKELGRKIPLYASPPSRDVLNFSPQRLISQHETGL